MTQFCTSLSSQNVKNPATELFKRVTRDCGMKLVSSDEPNILTQELALVVRDMEKALESEKDENKIESFIRGFKILIKKEKYLVKALSPTVMKKASNGDTVMDIPQESLFRIFLKVDQLQSEIIEIILDLLASSESNEPSLLRHFLNQLRYLPHIKSPENLTTKLVDIIEIAPFASQLEILDSIPEIIPDSEYNSTATELVKMLDKNDDLNGAIVDCLNALNLNGDIRAQIQDHILTKMLTGTCSKVFPIFLDFLLFEKNSLTVFTKIRNCLSTIMTAHNEKIVIFQKLQKNSSKSICESWLNVVGSFKNHNDHKPIDLLLLFMLHSSTKLKKRTIELIFRKRVKEGLFKCSLLEQLFEKVIPPQLLTDYFNSIIEIGCTLLRNCDNHLVIDFSTTLFKSLFSNSNVTRTQRQEILENFVVLIASDRQNISPILVLIQDLVQEISTSPNHTIILMRLLENLDSMELNDVRLIFDILTRLTMNDDSLCTLKEELHMIVRKHLSSNKKDLKYKGIVSAVVMVKNTTNTELATSISELTMTCVRSCCELTSFYYDQLASIFLTKDRLNSEFVYWLFETITGDFETIYVTDQIPEAVDDVQLKLMYNLNSCEEVDGVLAVNIAPLTLSKKILTLSSHFRLVRLLHYRHHNGDLGSIDALLGCGLILPDLNFDNYGIEQSNYVRDCLFHAINWLREVISAFVTQKNEVLRRKILERVDHLQELERLYKEDLSEPEKKKAKLSCGSVQFREIDTDFVKLLKYKLQDSEIMLSFEQLNYILADYNRKLDLVLKKQNLGVSNFFFLTPDEMMLDVKMVLLNLNEHFNVILNKLQEDEMCSEITKVSFGLILNSLEIIFSWSGFQHKKNFDLLRELLKNFRGNCETQLNSVNHLVLELVERLSNCVEFCDITQGVTLVKILEHLYNLNQSVAVRTKIAKVSCELLNQKWESCTAVQIDLLINSYLSSANIKTLCGIVSTVQDETENLNSKSATLNILKSITKSNFYILYRGLWSTLNERVKTELAAQTNEEHLTKWRTIALTMQGLMSIVKQQQTKANLTNYLKKSIAILKIFLTQGIPILEIELKFNPDQVVEIFKTIQTTTRFLHHLCCYSKVVKDGALMSHVPQFRLTLESLVYRVKAALVANGCEGAFWMGNLKNRDLSGDDILTQSSMGDEVAEVEEEAVEEDDGGEVEDVSGESEVFQ